MSNKIQGSAELTSGRPWLNRLKAIGTAVLLLLGIVLGARQCLRETVTHVGDLGMDDLGRQLWCQTTDGLLRKERRSDNARVRCESLDRTTYVIEVKNYGSSLFWGSAATPEEVVKAMREQPYSDALQHFDTMELSGSKYSKTMDDPVPISEIKARLERLGAKNLADLYTAMGFSEYILKDPKADYVYLKLTFSRNYYGHNPVKVDTDERFGPMCRYACKKDSVVPQALTDTPMYTFYLYSPRVAKEVCQCGIEQ